MVPCTLCYTKASHGIVYYGRYDVVSMIKFGMAWGHISTNELGSSAAKKKCRIDSSIRIHIIQIAGVSAVPVFLTQALFI